MNIFIWHHIWPDYEYRLKLMGDRACVLKAKLEASYLTLVPME